MAYIRIANKKNGQPRAALNTTIDAETLVEFKEFCKSCGFKMNTVIESFMKQFTAGEFEIRLKKKQLYIEEADSE